jgi:hypothetical protein
MPHFGPAAHESRRMAHDHKTTHFSSFSGIYRDFQMPLDVAGSLWSWDG